MTEEALDRANEIVEELKSLDKFLPPWLYEKHAATSIQISHFVFSLGPLGSHNLNVSKPLQQRILNLIKERIAELEEELKQL